MRRLARKLIVAHIIYFLFELKLGDMGKLKTIKSTNTVLRIQNGRMTLAIIVPGENIVNGYR